MRVLIVLPTLSAGGAEGFVTHLCVALVQLGVDVRVHLLAGVRRDRGQMLLRTLQNASIVVSGCEERDIATISNLFGLVRVIRQWRPDIVHANMYASEVACVLARPFTMKMGKCYLRRVTSTDRYGFRQGWVATLLTRAYEKTVACSPVVAAAYSARASARMRQRIVTIPNGTFVPTKILESDGRLITRRQFGISPSAFVVAHVGRMFRGGAVGSRSYERGIKGHDVLLDAFQLAFDQDVTATLMCVGDGPLMQETRMHAFRLGIGDRVMFLGERPEPWAVLQAADVFCFPSRYEGHPNALVEAAVSGLPIIASDIPEVRALQQDDAWILPPVDNVEAFAAALRRVRAEAVVYRELAKKAATQFRERFSMENCARMYLATYRDALTHRITTTRKLTT